MCQGISIFFLIVGLIVTTVQGLRWFIELTTPQEGKIVDTTKFELHTKYYISAMVLLAVPIVIATFFLIILVIFVGILVFEYRRNRSRFARGERFDDDI